MARKMYRYLFDGIPTYLNFKPSAGMLAAMRSGRRMGADRDSKRAREELEALAYMTWWARSRMIPIPNAAIKAAYGVTVLARVEFDYTEETTEARPRWVSYETGSYGGKMLYSPGGKFRGYGPTKWHPDKVLLRLEIPHWDHVPTVRDVSAHAEEQAA